MVTKIEWVQNPDGTKGETWNPITGCTPAGSPGCDNCYAKRMAQRLKGRYGYLKDDPFKVTFHPDRLDQPLRWKKPRRIFVVSMGDLFHEDVEWNWQYKIFEIMLINQEHTYLILTKRPKRMKKVLLDIWFHLGRNYPESKPDFPLRNIWLGITAENQQEADKRIPILLQIPATVRFVSIEPMLSEIKLWDHNIDECPTYYDGCNCKEGINWVIVGGESGPGARPMNPGWVRSIRDQCQGAGVPFFFKQWGEWAEMKQMGAFMATGRAKNGTHTGRYDLKYYDKTQANNITVDCAFNNISVYRVGKKKAGRILDGRIWDEVPNKGE
jgi:protein gp37